MDISSFMGWFLGQMVNVITGTFSLLNSVTFWGTSLLEFSVAMLVLGVIFDVVFSLVRSHSMRSLSKGLREGSDDDSNESSGKGPKLGKEKK